MSKRCRLVFTGPESTGKSFLTNLVAENFGFHQVDEYARMFLSQLHRDYNLEDLREIENGQKIAEQQAIARYEVIVQDTDFLTLWIWYNYKYGLYPERVYEYLLDHRPDHYFLCYPDILWEEDPLRENPNDRDELYMLYQNEIEKLDVSYSVIKGSFVERRDSVFSILEEML